MVGSRLKGLALKRNHGQPVNTMPVVVTTKSEGAGIAFSQDTPTIHNPV